MLLFNILTSVPSKINIEKGFSFFLYPVDEINSWKLVDVAARTGVGHSYKENPCNAGERAMFTWATWLELNDHLSFSLSLPPSLCIQNSKLETLIVF